MLQPDIMHVGGILEAKKIAAIADAQYVPVSFHNPFGPVATAAAIQLDACTTQFHHAGIVLRVHAALALRPRSSIRRGRSAGHYDIPIRPGLGVGEFRPEAARAHPFDPDAFLPMWQENWRANF